MRSWRVALRVFLSIPCMGILAGGAGMGEARAGQDAAGVSVMTYNIRHAEGLDGKVDLDRIAAVIRAAHADIVCLQEIDRDLPRTQHMDFPKLLGEKLGMTAVFEPNYLFDGGEYGNATLTRLEVVSHENLKLPAPRGVEPRGCLRTTVRVGDRTVDVLNAHLGLDAGQRKDQADAILKAIRNVPTILAGDFNEHATEPGVAALLTRLRDTAERGAAGKERIDFILVSSDVDVLSSRVLSTPETMIASDHLPRVADVRVKAAIDKAADKGVHDNDDERVTEAIEEGT